jgi:hypothetical protein
MNRSYPLVEVHYALWAVLTVPIGFAGMFFLVPGLIFEIGIPLEIIAAVLIFYIAKLTQGARAAWLFGLVLHGCPGCSAGRFCSPTFIHWACFWFTDNSGREHRR